jgi:hypothetical protein
MLPGPLIIFGLAIGLAQADDARRPVKNLDEANGQIHWPEEMTPKKADSFVHNQIFIKAPASVIWSNLVKAKDLPKWYANSSDVQITDGSDLGPKTEFNLSGQRSTSQSRAGSTSWCRTSGSRGTAMAPASVPTTLG